MATNPTLLAMPLAENGTKNVIPETQATAGDGLFSQSTGFPAETSLPLGAGGVAPSREDFNGLANLLGGVAFMAQKGFTFNYDAGQDYYKGCVVIDPNDGNRYLCIADMTAGTVAPSADTAGDYWIFYPVGVINKRDVITTSGTYTAPVDGWYKITIKGGGGGGVGAEASTATAVGGAAGGEGGTSIGYEYMNAGDSATVVIGAGGVGSAIDGNNGTNGGDSSITINEATYTGGGGKGGKCSVDGGTGGAGGSGTLPGQPGGQAAATYYGGAAGASGGGSGGGVSSGNSAPIPATNGGGGAGGLGTIVSGVTYKYAGGDGGNGYAWFEYFSAI